MTNLKQVYSDIPRHYELVNRLITLGMDRWWRYQMVKSALSSPPGRWLDMCSGTGETAQLLNQLKPKNTEIWAADYSQKMLKQFQQKPSINSIPITQANAYSMPYPDNTFDLITTSFATRNLHQSPELLLQAFSEFYRILKPGGRYVSIETTRPGNLVTDLFFRGFVALTVEPIGRIVSGTRDGYRYLSQSIRSFYKPDDLERFLLEAGFQATQWQRYFPGAVALHTAIKS